MNIFAELARKLITNGSRQLERFVSKDFQQLILVRFFLPRHYPIILIYLDTPIDFISLTIF